ncbi:putative conserved hypothetical protein, partial [Colletotrichum sublineola]
MDAATAFNTARFLQAVTTEHTWEALRMCWIDVYLGPPDWIVTDAGLNFHAAEFKRAARALSINIKEIPIEAHNSVRKVERYHTALRHAYEIFRTETDAEPEITLQIAVKAVNNTAGPNGLVPTLLVFGAYPRINNNSPPAPSTIKQAETMQKAMEEIRRIHTKRQVNDALATRNGPDTTATAALPLQSLDPNNTTQAQDTGAAAPPSELLDGQGGEIREGIMVATEQPQRQRRSRPRKNPAETFTTKTNLLIANYFTAKEDANYALAIKLRKKGVITTPSKPFKQSNHQEIKGLMAQGVFHIVQYDKKHHGGIHVFKSRLVRKIKGKNKTPYKKSRLVIQGKALQIDTSTFDPCLLILAQNNKDFALIGMQTNNTIGLTDKSFSNRKDTKLTKATFTAKPKQFLKPSKPITFNSGMLSLDNNGNIHLHQKGQGKQLQPVNPDSPESHQQYVEQRARGAYIASIYQPEACFDYSVAAQHQSPDTSNIKELN